MRRLHGDADRLSPVFLESIESMADLIADALPGQKTFALFIVHHDTPMPHEVTMIGSHVPAETVELLADWFVDRFAKLYPPERARILAALQSAPVP